MVTMETMGPDMSVQLPDNVLTLTDTLQMYFRHHRVIYRSRKVYWWVGGGGGENDSSVISLVKESRLLTFSELNVVEMEWTKTSLDQELDNC